MLSRSGILFVLLGATASGKSTVCRRLLSLFPADLQLSVSTTSRPPREGEQDGVAYDFVSPAAFASLIQQEVFFEHAEVHGNWYGTRRDNLEAAIAEGRDLLLDIDIQGAVRFKKGFPEATVLILVVPPRPELLRERLLGRGAISTAELDRRLATARREYQQVLELSRQPDFFDYILVNAELEDTVTAAAELVKTERRRLGRVSESALVKLCQVV